MKDIKFSVSVSVSVSVSINGDGKEYYDDYNDGKDYNDDDDWLIFFVEGKIRA